MPATHGTAPRTTQRRVSPRLLVAMLAALLAVTVGACGSASAGGEADAVRKNGSVDLSKVSLSVGDQKGGAKALLTASGEIDKMPYQVQWHEFTSGTPLVEAVHAQCHKRARVQARGPPEQSCPAESLLNCISPSVR